jgi:hypothetical protein
MPCSGATPWGEKDDTDVLRTARTYHIQFATEQAAQKVHRQLADLRGVSLFEKFKATAKKESTDPGSAPAGGDLGIVHEGEMVKSFEAALFALSPESISAPTRSEFGWHLIYATDFSQRAVADICSESLEKAIQRANAGEKGQLTASRVNPFALDYAQRISSLIGTAWGPPLKDGDSNLIFIKTALSTTKPGQASAVIHTEYTHAILTSAAQACRRSARAELSIDCSAKTATTDALYDFEGRAATGRRLNESRTKQPPIPFNQGLIGQIGKSACQRH